MALGSTHPRVKMSTRNIPGGKGGRCVRLTTLPPSCAECHEIWEPKPLGQTGTVTGRLYLFYITIICVNYTCSNVTNNKYGVVANFVVMSDNIMIMQSEL
jgi:hypothetical protein